MSRSVRIVLFLSGILSPTLRLAAQTSYTNETSNNTSACSVSGSHPGCAGNFAGLTDHYAQKDSTHSYTFPGPPSTPSASNTQTKTTVAAASNISLIPFNTLLYPGFSGTITTKIVCHFQAWFGSTSHIGIGMNMTQSVAEQAQNAIDRGCNYVAIDWYGKGSFEDSVAPLWLQQLDTLCQENGGVCPLQMAIMEDAGTKSGATVGGFENDLLHIYPTYMTHVSYWTMNIAGCSDRPVLLSFGWGSVLSDTGTSSWEAIKNFIHSSTGLNKQCNGEPLLLSEGQNGIAAFTNLDGAFNWIGVDPYWSPNTAMGCPTCDVAGSIGNPGSVTSIGVSGTVQYNPHLLTGTGSFSTDSWYKNALAHPSSRVLIGSAYAGFDDTNANWGFNSPHVNGRKMAQQCGQVWLNSWKRLTVDGFSGSDQVPFVGIPTWNDYEEGSAIEPGIDNCVDDSTFTLALNGSVLSWQISFTDATFGTSETIHHFTLFDGADSQGNSLVVHTDNISLQEANCQPVSQSNSISCSIDVSTLGTWPVGTHFLFVKAVGQPAIRNHMSSKPGPAYGITSSALTPATQNFGSAAVGQLGATESFTFQNTGGSALQVTSVAVAGDFSSRDGSATACQKTLAAGESCTINVTFIPTQAGSRTGTLTVNSTSNGSPNVSTLSGTGDNTTSSLAPATQDFGITLLGTSSTLRSFVVQNTGSTPMVVSNITISGDFNSPDGSAGVCQTTLNAGASCTFNVAFAPTQTGARQGTITVTSTSNSSPNTSTLSGTGTTSTSAFITGISPSSGAVGTTVTITGNNFGATPGNSTVSFNGALATIVPANWSATSISVAVPAGATTGNLVVTVGSQHTNGVFFTVPVPADNAVHIFGTNCATCGFQITDFTIQNSPLYGYVIQKGDILSFYQFQSAGSVAGITLCFANGEGSCDDDGSTVDQDGQRINADNLHGLNHFRKVDLSPSAGLTLNQITLDSSGFTQAGPWDAFFRDIQIISSDGTVHPIYMSGSTPTFFILSSGGASGQGVTIDQSAVPIVNSLSSTTASMGNALTIAGSNFGSSASIATVFFNGAAATPTSVSAGSVTVNVPVGATSGNVVVMVGGQASNPISITIQEDALQISGTNCSTCGFQRTDFTFQNSPLYGYTVQAGDTLYLLQNQPVGTVAGITLCFAQNDGCDDNGSTVDQDGQKIYADTFQGGNHFRRVDLSPSAGFTLSQISLDVSGFTQPGNWSAIFSDIEIVSADGTVRPIFLTGSTPTLSVFSSSGVTQQSDTILHLNTW